MNPNDKRNLKNTNSENNSNMKLHYDYNNEAFKTKSYYFNKKNPQINNKDHNNYTEKEPNNNNNNSDQKEDNENNLVNIEEITGKTYKTIQNMKNWKNSHTLNRVTFFIIFYISFI